MVPKRIPTWACWVLDFQIISDGFKKSLDVWSFVTADRCRVRERGRRKDGEGGQELLLCLVNWGPPGYSWEDLGAIKVLGAADFILELGGWNLLPQRDSYIILTWVGDWVLTEWHLCLFLCSPPTLGWAWPRELIRPAEENPAHVVQTGLMSCCFGFAWLQCCCEDVCCWLHGGKGRLEGLQVELSVAIIAL